MYHLREHYIPSIRMDYANLHVNVTLRVRGLTFAADMKLKSISRFPLVHSVMLDKFSVLTDSILACRTLSNEKVCGKPENISRF